MLMLQLLAYPAAYSSKAVFFKGEGLLLTERLFSGQDYKCH